MKANEAPEKIWLDSRSVYLNKPNKSGLTEYIRTDAFVEKALKWIDATFHGTSIDGFDGESVDVVMSDTSVYKDDLFESFKNYMKGEEL